jgi:hypothetical protein
MPTDTCNSPNKYQSPLPVNTFVGILFKLGSAERTGFQNNSSVTKNFIAPPF